MTSQERPASGAGSWLKRTARRLHAVFAPGAAAALTAASTPAAGAYEYQPDVSPISYEEGVRLIEARGRRVVRSGVDNYNPGVVQTVRDGLVENGARVEDYHVDPERFEKYRGEAGYAQRYPTYYGASMAEKHLEHFVTLDLLQLSVADIFLDIASEDSPVPDIFERLTGAQAYWQDIQYEPGINGRKIGGDACEMPVPDGFASAVALTCSLEHFERDADQRLCDELGRIVRPGGRLVIAPLYLFSEAVTQTDPVYSAQADVPFDDGVAIYASKDWRNRHGRFYSPATLKSRVLARLEGAFDCRVECIGNWQSIPDHTYLRFALFCRRR